jgi:glutathione synthase/RimK-type ligase-like ATP-grasp enzyme
VLLVGDASSRRAALLRAALESAGAPLTALTWRELLGGQSPVPLRSELRAGHAWCKIDSPGEDAVVTDALIERGWRIAQAGDARPHPLRHGELAFQHWWFAGFADLVTALAGTLGSLRMLNAADEILLMCDKWACQRHLCERGIPVPELLGEVHSFEELDGRFPARSHPAVFIKARWGSSAAGVMALRRHPDGRMAGYSSARLDEAGVIYNHLRISRYTRRTAIAALVDALARQGAYAERWLPKPRLPGDRDACYDLRVVASCARARQRVARISRSPLTNLHLGNARAHPVWLRPSEVDALEETVERAAAAFPGSRCIGFDVCLLNRQAYILEANAFGDLLPGLRHPDGAEGTTTYEDQARLVSADER